MKPTANNTLGHIQSIYPQFFRPTPKISMSKKVIKARDNVNLELFWKKQDSKSLIILTHGMEGHARQAYILGMAKTLFAHNFDVLSWNLRGCDLQPSYENGFYHGGATDDLEDVISHAFDCGYDKISLVGFSLGANIGLRYLGNNGKFAHLIDSAVAISCPCDLAAATNAIDSTAFTIYAKYFLNSFENKFVRFGKKDHLNNINTLHEFNTTMAPQLGFDDVKEYYQKASSIHYLKNIKTPTLILNAINDPFLAGDCYPYEEAQQNPYINLEVPDTGGHVGFYNYKTKNYYSEERTLRFVKNYYSETRALRSATSS